MTAYDPTKWTNDALQEITRKFDRGMKACLPLFNNLARQLLIAAQNGSWDIVIGEDCSGRPVTNFVSYLMEQSGFSLPTVNICTSASTRAAIGKVPYVEYLRKQAEEHGSRSALITTEKITTGGTARFMKEVAGEVFDNVEFAILGSRYYPVPQLDVTLYLGGAAAGTGEDEAVYKTFEGIVDIDTPEAEHWRKVLRVTPEEEIPNLFAQHDIRTTTGYPLHGVVASDTSPPASRVDDPFYDPLIKHVNQTMQDLAHELAQHQP